MKTASVGPFKLWGTEFYPKVFYLTFIFWSKFRHSRWQKKQSDTTILQATWSSHLVLSQLDSSYYIRRTFWNSRNMMKYRGKHSRSLYFFHIKFEIISSKMASLLKLYWANRNICTECFNVINTLVKKIRLVFGCH